MAGGARIRSGPAPDPNALRRDRDDGEWIELPAAGREGPPPKWPIDRPVFVQPRQYGSAPPVLDADVSKWVRETTKAELAMWRQMWSMPQAILWERQRQEREVALYVRRFLEASRSESAPTLSTLVKQLADSLGLTTPGLRSHRWRIVETPVAKKAAKSSSVRGRLRVVSDAGD